MKKLRKPTVTRWVADQVRRHHAEDVEALRSALSNVAAAQEMAITSGDRGALAEATAQRRDAMTALGRAVDDVLAAGERPGHHRDEVLGAIDADVTAEVASHGTFGVRDDLEVPERTAESRRATAWPSGGRQMSALRSKRRRPASAEQREELEAAEAALEGPA